VKTAVGTVDLDHGDTGSRHVDGQAGPVAAGALDADQHHRATQASSGYYAFNPQVRITPGRTVITEYSPYRHAARGVTVGPG
jgi:hypothetical protein